MSDSLAPSVRMHVNQEHAGIELSFSEKPNSPQLAALKENGFRWHHKKQVWFAKNTPERLVFAQKLACLDPENTKSEAPLQHYSNNASSDILSNTFAASYDHIGDAQILARAEGTLTGVREVFFQEEQLYFRRTFGGDTITLLDLKNAQKPGKTCSEWRINVDYFEKTSLSALLDREGVETVSQLLTLCKSGKVPAGLSIYEQTYKGVDVFSPFVEVKPLKKLPEKWTKRSFTQALMSGQLYHGEVDYRYTGDYAYDAAVGFRTGVALNMPSFAKNEIGDWSSCTNCYTAQEEPDMYGGSPIHYSEHTNSSKTLWFDVNCDIAEGKRRSEARAEDILCHNTRLEASCIHLSPAQIDQHKCYTLATLDTRTNTGRHRAKEEIIQGHALLDRIGPEGYCPHILKAEELSIAQDRFYVIADFFHRRDHAPDDPRVVNCGNWKQIVSGKALLELTAEGMRLPVILADDPEYRTYDSARRQLMLQVTGRSRFFGTKPEDFFLSLARLQSEFKRASFRKLDDLICKADTQKSVQHPQAPAPEHER